jgi:hypothetical protein
MKPELKTMEEKLRENPDELMENGLTRRENDEMEKKNAEFSGVVSLIVIGLSIYSIYMVLSI